MTNVPTTCPHCGRDRGENPHLLVDGVKQHCSWCLKLIYDPTPPKTEPELTDEDKSKLYDLGHYAFPVPPVPTLMWKKPDWIRYVDRHGRWLPDAKKD